MEIQYKIKPRNMSNGYSTAYYYQKIIKDITDISLAMDWQGQKRLNPNPNQNLLNQLILVKSEMQVMRKKMFVILNFMRVLYGQKSDDFNVVMRLYIGQKKQFTFISASKQMLTYADMPKHYVRAVAYEVDRLKERSKKLENMVEEYIRITPLAAYRDLLPEGRTLEDDIWEWIDMDQPSGVAAQVEKYIEHISGIVDINGKNEEREKCLEMRQKIAEKIAREKAEEKLNKLEKDRDLANGIASNIANNLYARRFSSKTKEWEEICSKAVNSGFEKPKVIVAVSTYGINGRTTRVPKYFRDDMTLTTAISCSTVLDDAKPLPKEITDLYNQYKIGYAEIMLT